MIAWDLFVIWSVLTSTDLCHGSQHPVQQSGRTVVPDHFSKLPSSSRLPRCRDQPQAWMGCTQLSKLFNICTLLQCIQLGRVAVWEGLGALTQKLLQVFEACNFGCAFILNLGLLVLFQQIAPLISAHGRGAVIASLLHLLGNLLPQMLVTLGCVEHTVHLLAICDQCLDLVLHPCFRPLFGSLDLIMILTSCVWRWGKKHLVYSSCQLLLLLGGRRKLWEVVPQ